MGLSRLAATGIAGVAAVLGLGLIGAGAHAAFTTSVTSKQTITAGKLTLVLRATPSEVSAGNTTSTLTLKAVGPVSTSFTTGTVTITLHNAGTMTAKLLTSTPGDTYNASTSKAAAFARQVNLCEVNAGYVLYNGKLSSASTQTITATLSPGATDLYIVNVYAGTETTACGAVTTAGTKALAGNSTSMLLTSSAEGGVITPTVTITAQT